MQNPRDPATWLTGLVLGAASALSAIRTSESPTLVSMGAHAGKTGTFEIFGIATPSGPSPLVQTEVFKLYPTRTPSGQMGLMKTNTSRETIDSLIDELVLLQTLHKEADALDRDAVDIGERPYNYGAQFPQVLESLRASEDKEIVFLGYHPDITTYKQLIPLSLLLRDERVDLKTLVWMFGKLLRLMGFVHDFGMTIGRVDASNVLLETDLHAVFVLDFSTAKENPTASDKRSEITTATKMAWQAAGGTDTTNPPYDSDIMSEEDYEQYLQRLRRLMSGDTRFAYTEMAALYRMADQIWPKEVKTEEGDTIEKRQFHTFRTYPR